MYRSVICCVLFVFLLVAAALSGPAYALTIPEAKLLADNEPVTLEARCVTYAAADFFYVEEDSRAMGIRVEKPAHGLTPGMRADVAGTMKSNAARERYILATSAVQNGEGSIEPVGVTNLSLGGEDWRVDGTKGQKGVSGAIGLNNVGLLVRVWGRYDRVDDTTITVDDGSGPVRCIVPTHSWLPFAWEWVRVTGVSSTWRLSSAIFPSLVLARDIEGIRDPIGDMVYIPAGSFLMGNSGTNDDATYGQGTEFPQHSVYLQGYWIGRYEVTRGEYRKFLDAGGYSSPVYWSAEGWAWRSSAMRTEPAFWQAEQDWGSGPFTQTDAHPVVGVTYHEAEAYCHWAGGRLPTEAEWEKAARWDGHPRVYPWGDTWDPEKSNNWYDTNPVGGGLYGRQTSVVGSYISDVSPYGISDMAGNVWEWCADWFASDYYSATPPGGWVNPYGPASGEQRVVGVGGWNTDIFRPRCALRYANAPGGYWSAVGFRLAR